jgi:hypothetical protein
LKITVEYDTEDAGAVETAAAITAFVRNAVIESGATLEPGDAEEEQPKRGRGRPRKETPSADSKPDAAALYETLTEKSPEPVSSEPAAADSLDELFGAGPKPKAVATLMSRDQMVEKLQPVINAKGVAWARENIIQKYNIKRFSDLTDIQVAELYMAHV